MRTDDGATPIGSLLILNVATRAEAQAILDADPATKAGLRRNLTIRRWNVAIFGTVVAAKSAQVAADTIPFRIDVVIQA